MTDRTYGNHTLDELLELDGKRTPGEWAWRWTNGGTPALVAPSRGLRLIVDAVRYGMNKATLRFAKRDASDSGGVMYHAEQFFKDRTVTRPDYQEPENPDMRAIPAAVNALRPLVERVRELEAFVERVAKARNMYPVQAAITDEARALLRAEGERR